MKVFLVFLGAILLGTGFAQTASDKKDSPANAKEVRWQGHIVRVNKGASSLSIRGGLKNMESTERQVFYDSSTEWTKQGKPADQSEFKEGSFVIALGQVDDKGVFHATRVDLRTAR
jgi:hypothetical protein